MRVTIGSDHAGFELKVTLTNHLRNAGHEVLDVGTHDMDPVDYPDYAEAVATEILEGRAECGMLICGSGVGACVAANKIPGIRAGLCHDAYSARQGVEHDDMNMLVLGGRVVGPALAELLAETFLAASFNAEERHRRRLSKIEGIESRYRQHSAQRRRT